MVNDEIGALFVFTDGDRVILVPAESDLEAGFAVGSIRNQYGYGDLQPCGDRVPRFGPGGTPGSVVKWWDAGMALPPNTTDILLNPNGGIYTIIPALLPPPDTASITLPPAPPSGPTIPLTKVFDSADQVMRNNLETNPTLTRQVEGSYYYNALDGSRFMVTAFRWVNGSGTVVAAEWADKAMASYATQQSPSRAGVALMLLHLLGPTQPPLWVADSLLPTYFDVALKRYNASPFNAPPWEMLTPE